MEPNTDLAISQWIENLPDTHPCLLYDSESIMPKRAKRGQKSGTSPSTLKSQKTHDTNDPDSATDATSRVDRAVQFVEDPLPLLSLTQSPLRGRGSTSLVTSRASSVDKSSSQEDDWYRLSNCDPPVNYLNVPQKVTFQPALDLLATLKDGSQKKDDCDQESLEKICLAARLLLHQHYVEEYWSSRVVIPLLGLATEPYGLLATSV